MYRKKIIKKRLSGRQKATDVFEISIIARSYMLAIRFILVADTGTGIIFILYAVV